jgi:hypothetical protein
VAEFNAQIGVSVESRKVERAIDRLEKRLNRLRDKARDIQLGGSGEVGGVAQRLLPPARDLTRFEKLTKGISESAKRASNALKGLAVAGGALAGADAINTLGQSLEKAAVSFQVFGKNVSAPLPQINALGELLRQATSGIEPFVQALQSAGSGGLTTAAGIATATTAFIAFEPAIEKALGKLRAAERLFSVFGPRVKETGISFEGYIQKIRKTTDIVSQLRESQQLIRRELDNVNSSTEEASDTADAYNRVTKRLNDELFRQEQLLKRSARAQQEFNNQSRVGTNLARSRASRAGSGFADFSRSASEVNTDQQAIDKAVARRQRKIEQFAKGLDDKYGQAPLMLPSSEMLNAAGRGIKRLSNYYGDLNTNIDKGLQAGRQFTEQLNAQAAKAQSLPPIFNQVGRALEATQKATSKAARLVGDPSATRTAAGPIQARTAGLRKLAALEQKLINETAELRAKKDLQSYNTRRKRIKYLADQEKAAQKKRADFAESLALGAGFPLLFGAGPGSVIGSVGGSFFGKGFGGQILGGAIGQIFDEFIASTTKLAQSLKSPAESLEALGEAGLNVDESSKMLVKSLLESGKAVEAQQVAFDEINKTLGPNAVKRLTAFNEQGKRIEKTFGEMAAEIQNALLPYLTGATYLVANFAESLGKLAKIEIPEWLKAALYVTPLASTLAVGDLGNALGEQTREPTIQNKTQEQLRKDYQLRKTFNQEELQYRKESVSLLNRELELLKMTGAEDKYRRSTLQAQLKVDQQRLAVRKATDAVNRSGRDVSAEIAARKQQFAASDALKRAEAEAKIAREAERVFDLYSKQADALQRVVTASKLRLQNEQAVAEGRTKLTGAYYNTELKIKDLEIQRAKQRGDTAAVLQLELDKVQLIYKQTIAQIQAEVERTRLKYRQVQLATKELEVANLRKRAEDKLTQADVDAMKVQQQALKIAEYNVKVGEQVANQQIRGAQAVFAASAESLIYANNQNKVADAAERTARAQERAARAAGGGGGGGGATGGSWRTPTVKGSFIQDPRRTSSQLTSAEREYVNRLVKAGILPEYQAKTTTFAEGGYVTRPTQAVVGERGENEYVIPESKMRSSMERYARGARGESVVEGNGSSNGMGSRTARGNTTVNVSTGPVMRMGNKDYVTVADLNNAVGSVVATLSRDTSNKYGKSPRVS